VNNSLQPDESLHLPSQPIDRLVSPLSRFLRIESASGLLLLACAFAALIIANSPLADEYAAFWKSEVGITVGGFTFYHSLRHLVNDGLMVIFFFVIGMEVKRELVEGTLADLRRAALPIAAALGGMIVPALIYVTIQYGQPEMRGWGIPMATDIAFVVGCLAVFGSRVPQSLRVLLLSLAIVDDIGAIAVIAIGYTENLNYGWLGIAACSIAIVRLLHRIGVRRFPPYVAAGLVAWFAFHESGVHATIAGVVLGLMTPAKPMLVSEEFLFRVRQSSDVFAAERWNSTPRRAEKVRQLQRVCRETVSPLEYLENTLHPYSSFCIMPIFALANAGVPLSLSSFNDSVAIAVALGLVVGKPAGIVTFSWIAVRLGIAELPRGLNWAIVIAGSFLAGIGFTMALFIDSLAFGDVGLNAAKMGVLAGSAVSALLGMGMLLRVLKQTTNASGASHSSATNSRQSVKAA
jgi:NhaA family Na+:H+ antiporter